eukprot:Nitzschia sp. Nitz4//scaffold13_size275219//113576//117825//NITZ4_000867-RA/size275219-processed-gene-0.84-mRNA-1//1//CDS//3329535993//8558//frame0
MNLSTVLIVGDSLSWEHYSSLGQLLGMRIHQSSQFEAKNKNLVQFGCHDKVRLAFRRDDNLSRVSDAIEETFPQVLVLNRGAHYQNDTKLMQGMQGVISDVKEWKGKCDSAGMKCHLFWRTTVPGHPLCAEKNFSAPNNDLRAMESWIADLSNYDNHTIEYHCVEGVNSTFMAKRANFGSDAALVEGTLVHSPDLDPNLCRYDHITPIPANVNPLSYTLIMLAPRGDCTFEQKAYAAKNFYGASALLVYDSLSVRYGWDMDTQSVVYPTKELDYECENGYGYVYDLDLDPPVYTSNLDPKLDMTLTSSNCSLASTGSSCDSQLCIVTGPPGDNDTSRYPVCCAWDLPATMQEDNISGNSADIVSVWLTIRQGDEFLNYIGETVTIKERHNPLFNASMIFLWLLACTITYLSCRFAATEYFLFRARLANFQEKRDSMMPHILQTTQVTNNTEGDDSQANNKQDRHNQELHQIAMGVGNLDSDDEEEEKIEPGELDPRADLYDDVEIGNEISEDEARKIGLMDNPLEDGSDRRTYDSSGEKRPAKVDSNRKTKDPPKSKKDQKKQETWVLHSLPPPERKKKKKPKPGYKEEHTLETNVLPTDGAQKLPEPWAAQIGGFEMSMWHVLGFVIMASFMLIMLFYFNFYHVIFIIYGFGCAGAVSHLIIAPIITRISPFLGEETVTEMNKNVSCGLNGFDITSQLTGMVWAILWVWFGLSHYRPSTNAFFWITIDVFGACFCILALSMLRLGNIKIATILLIAVFFYDIFFVFITPFFFGGESVMITVAQGGNASGGSDDYCYKYPDSKPCTGIDFLPMLLIIPRFNDYAKGSSLLGLGDIVLPGYLIVFCARLDEAKRIVGKHTKVPMDYPEGRYQGHFFWMMVAYGVGLILAFVAFGVTGLGQPALLYLVPCCLGTLCIVGWGELSDLWTGSTAIRLADKLKEKCERAWGRERMRRQVAKARAERAKRMSRAGTQGQSGRSLSSRGLQSSSHHMSRMSNHDNQRTESSNSIPLNSTSSHSMEPSGEGGPPAETDVCFGLNTHIGTRRLWSIVRREIEANPDAGFCPNVFKRIRRDLGGEKRYFVRDEQVNWKSASKSEIRLAISRMYASEKRRFDERSTDAAD